MDKINNTLSHFNIDLKASTAQLVAFPNHPHQMLYPGAHIATGEDRPGNIYHHGIVLDTEGEMEIAHFWGPGSDKRGAKVQLTTLTFFLAGSPELAGKVSRPLYLISYTDDDDNKRRETVERARAKLHEADNIPFDPLFSNCECFAAYCRKGKWISEQVLKSVSALIEACIRSPRSFSVGISEGLSANNVRYYNTPDSRMNPI